MRARRGAGSRDRLLPEALETFPVIAATGTADGRWSAIVAWTIDTLVNGDRPQTKWYAGGAQAMPLAVPELGLDPRWQAQVLTATGSYGAIRSRYLGPRSTAPLDGEAGPAADERLFAPYVE